MLKMTETYHAQIPNVAFAFGTEYKLNNDEMKVLAYLQLMRNIGTMQLRTHVTIIVEDMGWATSKSSRDNTRVANALEKLMNIGYIQMTFKKDIKKDALAIHLNNEDMNKVEATSKVDWKEKPFNFKGFTQIHESEYNLAGEEDYNLTVFAYHKWRANLEKETKGAFKYAIADKEWALVLELSGKHSRAIIDNCSDSITKISGKKYLDENGQWRQETNQYVKTVQTKVSEMESNNKNMSILEREMAKVTDENVMFDSEIFHQIFNKKEPMKFNGYRAWKETTCDHVKQAGQKKYDSVANSTKEGAKYVIAKWEREYEESLSSKKQTEIMMKRSDLIPMDDFEDEEEKQEREARQAEFHERKRAKDKKMQSIFDDN